VSVPGFLLLQYPNQVRKEEKLASGGSGHIFNGVLLDPELITQNQTNQIVLKEVLRLSTLSDEENKEKFLQEVSLMWFVIFFFYIITFL